MEWPFFLVNTTAVFNHVRDAMMLNRRQGVNLHPDEHISLPLMLPTGFEYLHRILYARTVLSNLDRGGGTNTKCSSDLEKVIVWRLPLFG